MRYASPLPAAICAGVIASLPSLLVPKPSSGTSPIVGNRAANLLPHVAPWPQPTIRCPTVVFWPVSDWKRCASPSTPKSGRADAAGTTTSATRAVAANRLCVAANLPVRQQDAEDADG